MKIGNYDINKKTFIIAEIGNNHNGDKQKAKLLIDKAIKIGADCAKFQMRHLDNVYRQKSLQKTGEDLGTEYILDLLERFELSVEDHREIKNYCDEKGIIYLCTPWDNKSVDTLENFDVLSYKVASADLTNIPLLERLAKTKKPLILSTGMSSVKEIDLTINFLNKNNVDFCLLHCNSTYPAPVQDINLNWMDVLKNKHPNIGYSGHERGINISLAAVAKGAKILERHFTLDRNMEGPDHAASLEENEFRNLVIGSREIYEALGNNISNNRVFSQGEMINRENLGKSIVASKKLNKGHILTREDLNVLSPGQGLSPQFIEDLIGIKINRNMNSEDYFYKSDLKNEQEINKKFDFKRPWGIPVRYHDYMKFKSMIKPDFFEFHLSYSDMELNINKFIDEKQNCGFVVHAPELFKDSHLMDLTTDDSLYREISMIETQKVINITREINKKFPNEKLPMIVANVGGFSMDKPFPKHKREKYYKQFFKSLKDLDTTGVEIIPQTMAPFPWHFGGQRHQNIFVDADEIVHYCEQYNIRICFDISHSKLTCNHFKYDFYEFTEKLAPYTAHIHMGDSTGVNGEGLQIGDGEIDFKKVCDIFNKKCPNAYFIPEIWQGHKNNGEGFWIALNKLNKML
jgi:N-acetylneuraminate synthase